MFQNGVLAGDTGDGYEKSITCRIVSPVCRRIQPSSRRESEADVEEGDRSRIQKFEQFNLSDAGDELCLVLVIRSSVHDADVHRR